MSQKRKLIAFLLALLTLTGGGIALNGCSAVKVTGATFGFGLTFDDAPGLDGGIEIHDAGFINGEG